MASKQVIIRFLTFSGRSEVGKKKSVQPGTATIPQPLWSCQILSGRNEQATTTDPNCCIFTVTMLGLEPNSFVQHRAQSNQLVGKDSLLTDMLVSQDIGPKASGSPSHPLLWHSHDKAKDKICHKFIIITNIHG
jgi:hypothetical protein